MCPTRARTLRPPPASHRCPDAPASATHSPSPPAPLLSPPGPHSLLCFPLAHTTERSSPSSSPYPWPPTTPSLADAPRSASTPSSSPPIHGPPEALHRRQRAVFNLRIRRPPPVNLRPQRVPGYTELLPFTAVSSSSFSPSPHHRLHPLAVVSMMAESSLPPP